MAIKKITDKHVDKVFELYIRYRDNWTCITCGAHYPNDTMLCHAGHYVGRGNHALRWNEKNVNAQCRSCNGKEHWQGDKNTYALALKRRYGESILEELEGLKHQVNKPNRSALYAYYKEKVEEYKNSPQNIDI